MTLSISFIRGELELQATGWLEATQYLANNYIPIIQYLLVQYDNLNIQYNNLQVTTTNSQTIITSLQKTLTEIASYQFYQGGAQDAVNQMVSLANQALANAALLERI